MRKLTVAILVTLSLAIAWAKTDLPEQSVVLPDYDEEVARQRLLESDMQPLEGIWYYPNEDMTFAIERWEPEPSHKIGYRILLIASEDLQSLAEGVEVADMQRVAMSKASRREATAVVVDNHGAVDNFVAAIAVDIGYAIVMVALSVPRTAGCVAGPTPTLRQLVGLWIHVKCNHLMTGIDASCQENARLTTVETGSAEEMLCRSVTQDALSPSVLLIRLTSLQTLQRIVHHLIGLACSTVHIDQEFIALIHKPLTVARGSQIVLRRVANHVFPTVGHVDDRPVRGTHHGLCPSILVPVVGNNILFVVLEISHIRPQVYPP